VEEIGAVKARKPLTKSPEQGPDAIRRIRLDTYVGMAFSNLVSLAIMFTTAATLHAAVFRRGVPTPIGAASI
jgi:Mn2+/Fe2+ NRAMP family transporter